MLYSEITAVCSQIHTKHISTLCGQNVALLNVKPGGKYSDQWGLKSSGMWKYIHFVHMHSAQCQFLLCELTVSNLTASNLNAKIHHNKHKRQPFNPITVHCQKQFP